jgi:hypothetical protein
METKSVYLSAALFALAAFASPAIAQKGTGEQTGVARQGLKLPIEAMSGTIKDIKIGPCEKTTGRSKEGAHLVVQAADGATINLHLGPTFALREELKQLAAGQEISFEAFRTERMPKDAYIAKSIKAGDKVFALRNDSLRPRWAGGRGGGRGQGMGRGGGSCWW